MSFCLNFTVLQYVVKLHELSEEAIIGSDVSLGLDQGQRWLQVQVMVLEQISQDHCG